MGRWTRHGRIDVVKNQKELAQIGAYCFGFVCFFLLSAGVLFRQVQQRTDAATDILTEGLLSTHTLLQKSALSGDMALFDLALFPTAKWRETQEELLARQLFWNRSSLGLWLDLETFDPEDKSQIEIDYSPDLQDAEVTAVLPYVIKQENDTLESIALLRTAVYRQVNGGWHYAPYSPDFWGETVTIDGRYLFIHTPKRDLEISEKLLQGIDQFIDEACLLPDLQCPANLRIELDFHIQPESNFELNQNYQVSTVYRADSGRILQVDMPSPTLVGLPVDEAGYEALSRGYAAQVIASIMSNIDSNCCSFGPNVPSPFALQLKQLGLQPPSPTGYHPQSALIVPPIPFPNQDIVALCQDSSLTTLYRYDPLATLWIEESASENGFISQIMSGEGQGVFLSTMPSPENSSWQLVWIMDGESTLLDVNDDWMSLMSVNPYWGEDSQDLVILYLKNENNIRKDRLIKIDPHSCQLESGCVFESLPYLPTFSPKKTRSLVRIADGFSSTGVFEYWVGDAAGEPVENLGLLISPKWLNEEVLLFTRLISDTLLETSLIEVVIGDGQYQVENEQTLLTSEDVNNFLQTQNIHDKHIISGLAADYDLTGGVINFFAIRTGGENPFQTGYLLQYDLNSGELDWLEPFSQATLMPNMTFSPDGRFLQVVEMKNDVQTLHLLDVETGELQSHLLSNLVYFQFMDWSENGEWLVVADDEGLHLIAPSHAYVRKVFYETTSCHSPIWVNKGF